MQQMTKWSLFFISVLILASCASHPKSQMTKAANAFLVTLSPAQKDKAYAKFSHKNRNDWDFFPDKFVKPEKKRFGLLLKDMDANQKNLAMNLLHTALSEKGMLTTQNVMMLEQVLFDLTKDPIRDTGLYYVSIFGEPSETDTWAWTFEGHHLSINVTLVNGHHLSITPAFYGTNPGVVKSGKHKGLQVLDKEENLGREIAKSLSPKQAERAKAFDTPPAEIFSFNLSKVDKSLFNPRKGLKYSEMTSTQRGQIKELIKVYIEKFRPELLENLDNSPLTELDSLVFVWVGSTNPAEPHYYRIVTTNHMIEYDNVRSGGTHPHTAWREFNGDFGEDLIRKHHKEHH